MKKQTQTIILAGLTIFILGAFFSFIWFKSPFFSGWANNQYFGQISEIRDNSVVIVDKINAPRIIVLDEKTKIMMGFHSVGRENLILGLPVMVIGKTNEVDSVQAEIIRIFNPRHRDFPR